MSGAPPTYTQNMSSNEFLILAGSTYTFLNTQQTTAAWYQPPEEEPPPQGWSYPANQRCQQLFQRLLRRYSRKKSRNPPRARTDPKPNKQEGRRQQNRTKPTQTTRTMGERAQDQRSGEIQPNNNEKKSRSTHHQQREKHLQLLKRMSSLAILSCPGQTVCKGEADTVDTAPSTPGTEQSQSSPPRERERERDVLGIATPSWEADFSNVTSFPTPFLTPIRQPQYSYHTPSPKKQHRHQQQQQSSTSSPSRTIAYNKRMSMEASRRDILNNIPISTHPTINEDFEYQQDTPVSSIAKDQGLATRMSLTMMPNDCFLTYEEDMLKQKQAIDDNDDDLDPPSLPKGKNIFSYCNPLRDREDEDDDYDDEDEPKSSRRRKLFSNCKPFKCRNEIGEKSTQDNHRMSPYLDQNHRMVQDVNSHSTDDSESSPFRPRTRQDLEASLAPIEKRGDYFKEDRKHLAAFIAPYGNYKNQDTAKTMDNSEESFLSPTKNSVDEDVGSFTTQLGEEAEFEEIIRELNFQNTSPSHDASETTEKMSNLVPKSVTLRPSRSVSPLIDNTTEGFVHHDCLCGKTVECNGISGGFFILDDPRGGYTRVPELRTIHVVGDSKTNRFRDSLLTHIIPTKDTQQYATNNATPKGTCNTLYIANHHFHPQVMFSQRDEDGTYTLPLCISTKVKNNLNLPLTDQDRVLKEGSDAPTDYYYAAPTYSLNHAKRDLKTKVRARRISIQRNSREMLESAGKSQFSGKVRTDASPGVTSLDNYQVLPNAWSNFV